MTQPKVTHTVTMTTPNTGVPLADLEALFDTAHRAFGETYYAAAKVTVRQFAGDQREPGYTTWTITA